MAVCGDQQCRAVYPAASPLGFQAVDAFKETATACELLGYKFLQYLLEWNRAEPHAPFR